MPLHGLDVDDSSGVDVEPAVRGRLVVDRVLGVRLEAIQSDRGVAPGAVHLGRAEAAEPAVEAFRVRERKVAIWVRHPAPRAPGIREGDGLAPGPGHFVRVAGRRTVDVHADGAIVHRKDVVHPLARDGAAVAELVQVDIKRSPVAAIVLDVRAQHVAFWLVAPPAAATAATAAAVIAEARHVDFERGARRAEELRFRVRGLGVEKLPAARALAGRQLGEPEANGEVALGVACVRERDKVAVAVQDCAEAAVQVRVAMERDWVVVGRAADVCGERRRVRHHAAGEHVGLEAHLCGLVAHAHGLFTFQVHALDLMFLHGP